ncbi:MAG: YoaK family protein [Sphingomicrobium sp.]
MQALAVCLSAVAGYVDAVGYLASHGYFVSFMSGNSTRFAVSISRTMMGAITAGSLIGSFLAGVVIGSLCGAWAGERRRSALLLLVAATLAQAAFYGSTGNGVFAIGLTALAMGAMNAALEQPGGASIGLTYMTGTLVKIGQGVAATCLGRGRTDWFSFLALWAGLVSGAIIGAAAYPNAGFAALWFPVAILVILALLCRRSANG